MRENIGLFKAKRKDNGEWVEGYFAIEPNFYPVTGVNNYTIRSYTFLESGEIVWTGIYKVDPNTVSQCTGLEDKNGKLIFENDIVKDDLGFCLTVCFGCFSIGTDDWGIEHITQGFSLKFSDESGYCGLNNDRELEVIGNIFNGGNQRK